MSERPVTAGDLLAELDDRLKGNDKLGIEHHHPDGDEHAPPTAVEMIIARIEGSAIGELGGDAEYLGYLVTETPNEADRAIRIHGTEIDPEEVREIRQEIANLNVDDLW